MNKRQVAPSTGIQSIEHGTIQRKHVCEEALLWGLGLCLALGSQFRLEPNERLDWQSGVAWTPTWRLDFSIAFLKTSVSHRSLGSACSQQTELSRWHQPACSKSDAAPHSS